MTSKYRKENSPPDGEPWVWLTREMLESPAWKAVGTYEGVNEFTVLSRIWIEHMAHAGTMNGNLIVTYSDFEKYGVRRKSIKKSLVALEALGWIDITVQGKPSFEGQRFASRYALTCLGQPSRGKHATNRWRSITQPDAVLRVAMERHETERAAKAARGLAGQKRKAAA